MDFADFFHTLLAFFLFFPEFALAGDVAAVPLGSDVFGNGSDSFAGMANPEVFGFRVLQGSFAGFRV